MARLRKAAARKRRIFLSYNHADKRVADKFAEWFSSAGYRIANDESLIEPGKNWLLTVGHALGSSDAVIFLLSRAALRSPATSRELEYVLSTPKFKDHVWPVLIDRDADVPWIIHHLPVIAMREKSVEDVGRVAQAVVKQLEQRA